MATDPPAMAVNGSYAAAAYDAPEPGYDASRAGAGAAEYVSADASATQGSGNGANSGNTNAEIPKDEVGWYFVEQYYTTLSKSPEKLFLFYNKSSQFVSGTETEKAPVCVGQKAINERIKELDIQDCKVRVTNVDSQGSQSNIVIQVIGEISNKSAPQRKFTQTFVLAEQANGYFVLNDIFRYLLDEEEDFGPDESEPVAAQPEVTGGQPEAATIVDDIAAQPEPAEAEANTQTLESREILADETEAVVIDEAEIPPTVEVSRVEEPPAAVVDTTEEVEVAPEQPIEVAEPLETVSVEPPKESQAAATVVPAQPVAEPVQKPKTWANLVRGSGAAAVTPALPAAAPTAPSSSTAPKPTPTLQTAAAPIPTAPAASSTTPQDSDQVGTPQSSGSEWQTAGQEHSRKQSRNQGAQTPAENSRAYIKNVNDSIDIASLQAALAKIADISYIDINRQKNCAFVDFSTPAGYRAAVAANPHEVSGQPLYVEERRVRPAGSYPGGAGRGGNNGMRGSPRPGSQGRGAMNKDGARGNYTGRGRGNAGTRGRGGTSQAA